MRQVRGPHRTEHSELLRIPIDRRHADELISLRAAFAGPERGRLDELEHSSPSADSIGAVLPEAVAFGSQHRPDELGTALGKPVSRALRDLVRREPELIADVVAPTIGTAVRRAVADAIAALIARMNQLLERTVSMRAIRWRYEARRTGRPLSEVILARTLLYQVEWVVLIHTETSLVLSQATLEGATRRAPDQIAAMLQALGAFVREAFRPTPAAELRTLEVADLTVWIERDPSVTLAAAIRGTPPPELRQILHQTLGRVRTMAHAEITKPVPDTTRLSDVQPLLSECLKQELVPPRRRAPWVIGGLGLVVAGVIAMVLWRSHAASREDDALRTAYARELGSVPGLVVLAIERDGGAYRIRGLRDPRSEDPAAVLARSGLPPPRLDLASYDSGDPAFATPLTRVGPLVRELESLEIRFEVGAATVDARSWPMLRAIELLGRTERAAAEAGLGLCVIVLGGTDESGTAAMNSRLRLARARNVGQALRGGGVSAQIIDDELTYAQVTHRGRRSVFRALLRATPEEGCPR